MKRLSILFLLVSFISGCSSSIQNLSTSKQDVKVYYELGGYDKELKGVVNTAITEIKGINVADSSIAIFDIDETALSNYELIKNVDFGYVPQLWHNWIMEAKAPAINPVKDLYDVLVAKKVKIVFLTGRGESEYDATYKNLVNAGYTNFDTLIVRSSYFAKTTAANYKRIERTVLASFGYKIIACIGDQNSDFIGGNTGIIIKVPNYLYTIE